MRHKSTVGRPKTRKVPGMTLKAVMAAYGPSITTQVKALLATGKVSLEQAVKQVLRQENKAALADTMELLCTPVSFRARIKDSNTAKEIRRRGNDG